MLRLVLCEKLHELLNWISYYDSSLSLLAERQQNARSNYYQRRNRWLEYFHWNTLLLIMGDNLMCTVVLSMRKVYKLSWGWRLNISYQHWQNKMVNHMKEVKPGTLCRSIHYQVSFESGKWKSDKFKTLTITKKLKTDRSKKFEIHSICFVSHFSSCNSYSRKPS